MNLCFSQISLLKMIITLKMRENTSKKADLINWCALPL